MYNDREELIEEIRLRKYIRKGIKIVLERKEKQRKNSILEENKLRLVIRDLIKEATATADNDPAPHSSTGINVLEDLLKKIIPVIEMDFKKLTTDQNQRNSFRVHILKAIEDTLAPSRATIDVKPADVPLGDLQEQEIDLVVDKPENDPSFIDIRTDKEKAEDEEVQDPDEREEFGVEGEDKTGRNVAFDTFKKIGTNIVDAYDVLGSDQDRELFYDYLITNTKLYLDKFENDLGTPTEPTTDAYEAEKQNAQPSI